MSANSIYIGNFLGEISRNLKFSFLLEKNQAKSSEDSLILLRLQCHSDIRFTNETESSHMIEKLSANIRDNFFLLLRKESFFYFLVSLDLQLFK